VSAYVLIRITSNRLPRPASTSTTSRDRHLEDHMPLIDAEAEGTRVLWTFCKFLKHSMLWGLVTGGGEGG